jgi:hypothetical protein
MPERVRINEDLDLIEIQSYCDVSIEDIAESLARVRRICADTGRSRVLVDTTDQTSLPNTTDLFELFSTHPLDFRVAILMEKPTATAGDLAFIETVARNRNVTMKLFRTRDEALAWL